MSDEPTGTGPLTEAEIAALREGGWDAITGKRIYKCKKCKDTGYVPCMCFMIEGDHACPDCELGKERAKNLRPHSL